MPRTHKGYPVRNASIYTARPVFTVTEHRAQVITASAEKPATTNHVPMLIAAIGCFLVALISIGSAVALFQYTFSGLPPARFAMFFFASSCLAILGFASGAGTIGAFFDWGELFITSLEERSIRR